MRGWVAISVTATAAAAPRRIRKVLRMIIGEPSGPRLPPTTGQFRLDLRVIAQAQLDRIDSPRRRASSFAGTSRPGIAGCCALAASRADATNFA
jgi:hypothetical protein